MSFTGKVAVVTGAASGIGAATARALAKEGAKVVLVDTDEAKLKKVAKQCGQHGNLMITADITKDENVRTILKDTIEKLGQLDVLVNNAGITRASIVSEDNFMEHFDVQMNTNLRSMVYLTHLAAPHLIKTKGNIVNVSSVFGLRVLIENYASYSVSKACVSHFTCCAAFDLAPHGVRVNAVAPGGVKTNIMKNAGFANSNEIYETWSKDHTLLKKLSQPEEIADIILFLASDKARSVTGSSYVCDNGSLLM